LCSTLSSCLDSLCPLSTRPARSTQSHSWLSDTLRTQRSNLRAAERKWHKSAALDEQATRHCWPPSHPASLLRRRLFSMTRSTVQLTLGNYSPPSKLCSALLLLPQQLTSLLITLLPFSQRKWQPSGNSSTNCLPPLRAQPSMAHRSEEPTS